MHVLLCGYPPFFGRTEDAIFEKIQGGLVNLNTPEWKSVSTEGKVFIRKLLNSNPKQRISAEQALKEPWIRIY